MTDRAHWQADILDSRRCAIVGQAFQNMIITYTQTKKKRPIFMVLYLSIQLSCCNKHIAKMFIKCRTHTHW